MLHDLKWLDPGKKWPPPAEEARLKRDAENRKLYEAQHVGKEGVFQNAWRLLRYQENMVYEIVVNFPRRLSNLWGDLLVGEPPTYKAEGDSTSLDELVERGLNVSIRECAIDMSRFGDGLLKCRLSKEGPVVEAISPELWFPVVSRGDVRDIKHHVLAWTFEEERDDGLLSQIAGAFSGTKRYLYAEIHSPGQVEYRLHELTAGSYIGPEASDEKKREVWEDWRPVETHRADGMLVVHVPNMRTTNRLHGHDDYEDIEGLVQEWEVRLAQISRVLDRHADPGMAGPPIETPDSDTEAAARVSQGEKYFTVEPDAEGRTTLPQYITWDGNLESAFKEIEELKESLYLISETSATAFGHSQTGYAESGTSLKLRMQAPIAKAARLRTVLDPAVKEAIRTATALAGKPVEAEIAWKDGLPQDDKEQTEIEASRQQAGLSSKLSAVQRLYDLDEDAAQEELDRIEEEGGQRMPSEGVPQGSLARSQQLLEGALGGARGSNANGAEPPAREPAAE